MGAGTWSTDVYSARSAAKKAAGQSAFSYNDDVLSRVSYDQRKVHDRLSPLGINVRESRDSDEHPNSNAIAIAFDVTGSMGHIPRVLQTKLPKLHGLIQRRGYIEDPQVMFAAIGDSFTDRAPLQVGQFESDNRMEEDLEHIWLEGGGGGTKQEGYEVFLYFLARKTSIDCVEKRGKKGYAFIVGDELPYPAATRANLKKILGDDAQADISIEDLVAEVQEKYELFFLYPRRAQYFTAAPEIADYWRKLLGERLLILDDESDVCETIALTVGLNEGVIGLDQGLADLEEEGASASAVASLSALAAATPAKALGAGAKALPAGATA